MKSFSQYLKEYREFQRTDKTSSVSSLHSSGAYEPDSKGYIKFTTYHGGNFGEKDGSQPTLRGIAKNPTQRLSMQSKREAAGLSVTPGQPRSSYHGLSTTPDATAAREYRGRREGTAPYVANPDVKLHPQDRLYELQGKVHTDNVKKFKNYEDFHNWHDEIDRHVKKTLSKDKNYNSMEDHSDEKVQYALDHVHKHITETLGTHVAIIGTDKSESRNPAGSARAKVGGEIMIFKPHSVIGSIKNRTSEVDEERQKIKPAIERLGTMQSERSNRLNNERLSGMGK